jgi:hypothetical protein
MPLNVDMEVDANIAGSNQINNIIFSYPHVSSVQPCFAILYYVSIAHLTFCLPGFLKCWLVHCNLSLLLMDVLNSFKSTPKQKKVKATITKKKMTMKT